MAIIRIDAAIKNAAVKLLGQSTLALIFKGLLRKILPASNGAIAKVLRNSPQT